MHRLRQNYMATCKQNQISLDILICKTTFELRQRCVSGTDVVNQRTASCYKEQDV